MMTEKYRGFFSIKWLFAVMFFLVLLIPFVPNTAQAQPAVGGTGIPGQTRVGNGIEGGAGQNQTQTAQQEQATQQLGLNRPDPNEDKGYFLTALLSGVDAVLGQIAEFIYWVGGLLLAISATFMNFVIENTIVKMSNYVNGVDAIKVAWKVFRDLANIAFIFILLYIGISTIIKGPEFNTKKLLGKVIFVAIIINFSFFITTLIIDASNVLTLVFKNSIEIEGEGGEDSVISTGISQAFTSSLNLQRFYNVENPEDLGQNGLQAIQAALFIFVFNIVLAIIFLIISILFLTRMIILLVLLILSPIAFMGSILPQTQSKISNTWWSSLIGQAFFAPVIFIFFWVTILIIKDPSFLSTIGVSSSTESPIRFIQGGGATSDVVGILPMFLQFSILIGLLIAGMVVAKSVASSGGSAVVKASGTMNKIAGAAVFGGAGWAGRNIVGRGANAVANTDFMKRRTGMPGTMIRKGLQGAAGSSYDVRGTGSFAKLSNSIYGDKEVVGKSGGEGGFIKARKEKEKARYKREREYMESMSDGVYVDKDGNNKMMTDESGNQRAMTYTEVYAQNKNSLPGVRHIESMVDKIENSDNKLVKNIGGALVDTVRDIPGFSTISTGSRVKKTMVGDVEKSHEKNQKIIKQNSDIDIKINDIKNDTVYMDNQGKLDSQKAEVARLEGLVKAGGPTAAFNSGALKRARADLVAVQEINSRYQTQIDSLENQKGKPVKTLTSAERLKKLHKTDDEAKKDKEKEDKKDKK